jgi:hypothetical protein
MARGFESKDVEFQQAEAERQRTLTPAMSAGERLRHERRDLLELSLARLRADLAAARVAAHRTMVEQAILALEDELGSLSAQ